MANFHQAPSFCVFLELKGRTICERKEGRKRRKKFGKESKISNKLKFYIHFYIESNISNNLISFIHPLLDHV